MIVMALKNYVELPRDREKVLRIKWDSFHIEPRSVTDPKVKAPKIVNAASMRVIEEDGVVVDKPFSTLSDKLATTLQLAANNGTLYRFKVGITRRGEGYLTEYTVRFF